MLNHRFKARGERGEEKEWSSDRGMKAAQRRKSRVRDASRDLRARAQRTWYSDFCWNRISSTSRDRAIPAQKRDAERARECMHRRCALRVLLLCLTAHLRCSAVCLCAMSHVPGHCSLTSENHPFRSLSMFAGVPAAAILSVGQRSGAEQSSRLQPCAEGQNSAERGVRKERQ